MKPRDIRSLDIGMLRTFDALIRERSVSRAAERLFLSQPAVSASLNRLREVFADPLFTRTPHGVAPTPRALALADAVQRVLGDIARLLDTEPVFEPAASQRIFRIAGSDYPSHSVLPSLGRRLSQCGPGLRLMWEPTGTWSLVERMERGDLDLAMVARLKLPRDLRYELLYEDSYVYALRRDHPQAGQAHTLETFCQVPQIFLGYGSHVLDDFIDETLARQGLRRHAHIAVTGFGQILHQIQHSDHAAVLPLRVAQAHAQTLTLAPPPFALPPYQSLLCWHPRAHGDPGVQWLKQEILAIVRGAGEVDSIQVLRMSTRAGARLS